MAPASAEQACFVHSGIDARTCYHPDDLPAAYAELNVLAQFDQIYVINLDSRPDRLREMGSQLRSIGYDFDARIQRFPAVKPSSAGGFRTIGARGCFMSHLGCLDKARRSGAGSLLILEDDVDFSPDLQHRIPKLAEQMRQDGWGMFYGGGRIGDTVLPAEPSCDSGIHAVPADVGIGTTHCVAVREPWLSLLHDYLHVLLGRPAGHPDGGPMDVDGAYSWFRRTHQVPTLIAFPEIAVQRSSSSDVTPQWFDQAAGLGAAVRRLRAFTRRYRK